ncbi:hypothetical protein [Rhodospirillaceae bacterium SYSU D60014]|uniref:hypothetical protein n=1 Tax=Virgifigura deserti TaxID=2268457 RepID=UPI000E662636
MYYSEKVLEQIIEAGGGLRSDAGPAALKRDLEHAAFCYDWRTAAQSFPANEAREEMLASIEDATRRVLKLFAGSRDAGPDAEPRIPNHVLIALSRFAGTIGDSLTFNPDPVLGAARDLIRAAAGFRDCANRARLYLQHDVHGDPKVNAAGPSAQSHLIGADLPEIYERHFGRPFQAKGAQSMDFVVHCLKPLGVEMRRDAITQTIKRFRRRKGDT